MRDEWKLWRYFVDDGVHVMAHEPNVPSASGASLELASGETVVAAVLSGGVLLAVTSQGAVWRLDLSIPTWILYVAGCAP